MTDTQDLERQLRRALYERDDALRTVNRANARLQCMKDAGMKDPSTHTIPIKMYGAGTPDADEENHVCSRIGCGRKAWDDGVPLTYITVVTQVGEEGYGEIVQALCNEHLAAMTQALKLLGFVSHNHHGTQMFDDDMLCGRECPHPTEYGPELVQP